MVLSVCFLSSPHEHRLYHVLLSFLFWNKFSEISFLTWRVVQHHSLFFSGTSPTGNIQSSTLNEVAMPPPLCLTLFCLSSHFTAHPGSVRRTCWSRRDYSGHHIYDHDPFRRKDRHGWCAFGRSMKREPRRRRRDGHRSWTFTDPVRGKTLSVVRAGCTCSGAPAAALRRL